MIFSLLYWAYYHAYGIGLAPDTALEVALIENAARAAQKSGVLDDDALWRMSQDAKKIAAGKVTFDTMCAACHKPDMTGLIGPNLVDNQWIRGGKPMDSMKTITEGNLLKGMPAWGPLLGRDKIAEVCAYIFSYHKPGEEIIAVPGWTPPAGVVVPLPPPAPGQ
jgi:cytochrome c oxidase cbb3-type subunit 3